MENTSSQKITRTRRFIQVIKNRVKRQAGLFAIIAASIIVVGVFSVSVVSTIADSIAQSQRREISLWDLSGSNLTPQVLKWQDAMSKEMSKQGIDQKWLFVLLGIMQVESGGHSDRVPDIMQASESLGLAPNSISDPYKSIEVGVKAFKNSLEYAERYGITDPKAIIFSYNTGAGFISYLSGIGESKWTIEIAERYSRDKVFPAVTGLSPSQAVKSPYNTPYSQAVGKPYYYRNGGNFHYANAVFYAIGGEQAIYQSSIPTFLSGNPDALPGAVGNSGGMMSPPAGVKLAYGPARTPGPNPYPYGQCTWYAYGRMHQIGKPIAWFPGNAGNGGQWMYTALQYGYRVEKGRPAAGTAVSFPPGLSGAGSVGHVAFVEATFSDGSILISESNMVGAGIVNYRTIGAAEASQASYIYM
ncbi:lysozyme family protein [Aerococcus urinae]|uniref:Lysozyme family protein n=2 Tax=Aerococcus TaxID=1375 RepID=A0A9Q4H4Z4_9LACT|nr:MULTISPECIES: lysozyme family protein [Aerococcus]MBU5611105.1 lysozyme family protein [Aerococcus urinae]MCY3065786.1 lysozyme family protein [Aerococcus mictus]MCY3071383.1 lysozyme family protein [Aerococcus mictus]MCY3071799.1 lysozyme family protein [Aerococcus mictus]MCY3074126.1 lysozyme family protein [Aerococcus mictus]